MGRWLGALYLAGGIGGFLCVALPHWVNLRTGICLIDSAVAVVVGLLLAGFGDRLRPSAYPVLAGVGTGLISIGAYGAGRQGGALTIALFYAMVSLYIGAMFSRRVIVAELCFVAAAHGAVLIDLDERGGVASWVVAVLITTVVAAVTSGISQANRRMALHDPLTDLPNRRALDESLRILLAAAGRRHFPMSVSVLDLDHFKQLNADLGHQGADELLVELANRWRAQVRAEDLLARYGGDEFVLLLPDTDLAAAMVIVERLGSGGLPGGAFSAGVATWDGAEEPTALLRRADNALFEAKARGRGRVIAATPLP